MNKRGVVALQRCDKITKAVSGQIQIQIQKRRHTYANTYLFTVTLLKLLKVCYTLSEKEKKYIKYCASSIGYKSKIPNSRDKALANCAALQVMWQRHIVYETHTHELISTYFVRCCALHALTVYGDTCQTLCLMSARWRGARAWRAHDWEFTAVCGCFGTWQHFSFAHFLYGKLFSLVLFISYVLPIWGCIFSGAKFLIHM